MRRNEMGSTLRIRAAEPQIPEYTNHDWRVSDGSLGYVVIRFSLSSQSQKVVNVILNNPELWRSGSWQRVRERRSLNRLQR